MAAASLLPSKFHTRVCLVAHPYLEVYKEEDSGKHKVGPKEWTTDLCYIIDESKMIMLREEAHH